MPEITRFYGIIVRIQFRGEHNPPHIHAQYGDREGLFEIRTMKMLEGNLPNQAQKLVSAWGKQYTAELLSMWDEKTLIKLPPLE